MQKFRILVVLLAIGVTAGCKAQAPLSNAALDRRIEVTVRSQFNVPPDYNVTLGARKPSTVSGYQELPITFSNGARTQSITFLISADGTKLARLDTYDLTKEPGSGINLANRPIRGNPAAKVTIINFDDLECPYCARMHQSLFPATLQRYKGQIKFVYKDFPLTEIHPWAMHASVDADCLAAQNTDAYWSYVDYLHSHGDEVTGTDRDTAKSFLTLDRIARQQAGGKLDSARLDACLAKQDQSAVDSSLKEAMALGLDGAPALFVNGERINGALPEPQIWAVIDRALRAAGEKPPAPPEKVEPPLPPMGAAK